MGNCGTCEHFDTHDMDEFDRADLLAEFGEGLWGYCGFVVCTRDGGSAPHSARAYPQDASGYRAWLQVRSDFGCIEHTPAAP